MTHEEEMAEKRKVLMLDSKNSPKWLRDSNKAYESLQKMREAEKKGDHAKAKKYSNMHVDQVMRNSRKHAEYRLPAVKTPYAYRIPRDKAWNGAKTKWERFCEYCETGLYDDENKICSSCATDLSAMKMNWTMYKF